MFRLSPTEKVRGDAGAERIVPEPSRATGVVSLNHNRSPPRPFLEVWIGPGLMRVPAITSSERIGLRFPNQSEILYL